MVWLTQMPVEYEKQYLNMTKHYSRYHGYAYDGVWAAALAIEEVGRKAHAYNLSLEDFSYRYNSTTYIIDNTLPYMCILLPLLPFLFACCVPCGAPPSISP